MSDYSSSSDHPLPLHSRADVARLVGFPIKQLNYWIVGLAPNRRYTTFSIPRRRGKGTRIIHAPIKPIKDMQLKLAPALQACYRPPVSVHGYVRARSILSNAQIHLRKRWVLRIDIREFFPSINYGRVRGVFMAYPFNYTSEVATLLAQICCHANELPHGAPTSPTIANLICRGLDKELLSLAQREHCHYSRYCDDLIFSATRKLFSSALVKQDEQGAIGAGPEISAIIVKHGFHINAEKTSLRPQAQRQMVTGLVVNAKPNIPREYICSLRNLLYIWRRYSLDDARERFMATQEFRYRPLAKPIPALNFQWMIRGRVQYVGHIKGWDDPVYLGLAKALAAVDQGFEEPKIVRLPEPCTLEIFVEGETDINHLEAALDWFREQGRYNHLQLKVKARAGDEQLFKFATLAKETSHDLPIVCLFDRDNPKILKDVLGPDGGVLNWGNGVYSWAIPPPSFRDANSPVCIEMLYGDAVLRLTNENGKRVYLKSEFDRESGSHLAKEDVHRTIPKSQTLIAEDVYRGKQKVSLGKREFADMIRERCSPYESVSFEGFESIFETLDRIQRKWQLSRR
jgi:RNA-directed DNA polymerase